jgi:hypothetical protein
MTCAKHVEKAIMPAPKEPIVSLGTPMPKGYGFLKKGYAYKTALCRRETHNAGKTLYVVKEGSQILGLRAPKPILAKVHQQEMATRSDRRECVAKRDDQDQERFLKVIQEQYPRIPAEDADQIAKWAMRKRSGRVGRTSTLPLEKKVHLAVAAHIRHRHTDYEKLFKEIPRDEARKAVAAGVKGLLLQWKEGSGLEDDPIVLEDSSSGESEIDEVGSRLEQTRISPRKSPRKHPTRRPRARQPTRRHSFTRKRSRAARRSLA